MPIVPVGTFSAYSDIVPSGSGYFAGGYGAAATSRIDKLNFFSEAMSTLSATLLGTTYFNNSVSNVGTAGYVSKGRDGVTKNTNKLSFSNESISTTGNLISTASYGMATISNNGVAGYFGGGTAGARVSTTVDKIAYSSDTSSISTSLISGNYYISGMSNSAVAGYFTSVSGSTLNRNSFPSDTMSSLSLSFQQYHSAYFSNTGVAGYLSTGGSPAIATTVKFSFISQTGRILSTSLSEAKNYASGISHSQVAGYVGGGTNTANAVLNTIEKIQFNSDTMSVISATLPVARDEMSPLQNGGVV